VPSGTRLVERIRTSSYEGDPSTADSTRSRVRLTRLVAFTTACNHGWGRPLEPTTRHRMIRMMSAPRNVETTGYDARVVFMVDV
jgi:hypothetical protein